MNLAQTDLFRGANAADLAAVERAMTHRDLMAGERLHSAGESPGAVFFIEMGAIDMIPEGKDMRVGTLASGQLIGHAAFFDQGPDPFTAVARETTRLLALPFDTLAAVLEERPDLALVVYRNAARAFAHVVRQMARELEHPYF